MHNSNLDLEPIFFAGEINQEIPFLDLHGYSTDNAKIALNEFLNQEYIKNKSSSFTIVRVITGKGSGRLMSEIWNYLEREKDKELRFIIDFRKPSHFNNDAEILIVL